MADDEPKDINVFGPFFPLFKGVHEVREKPSRPVVLKPCLLIGQLKLKKAFTDPLTIQNRQLVDSL